MELCAGIPEGGTTPSYGDIMAARNLLDRTRLHVIIRPRGGDFLYSPLEQRIMLEDITNARRLGADGVVLGCLTPDGDVDLPLMARMMKAGSSCTGCGLCARMCPMGNITMKDGKPVFSSSCSLCVRCSFSCPVNAISIGLLDGWKVNGEYQFERIMQDSSLRDTIPVKELPFLYRGYYRRCEKMLNQS